MEDTIINIGKRREFFFDNTMIDTSRNGSFPVIHEPVKRECVLTYDDPWGGDCANYMVVLTDPEVGVHRMYNTVSRSSYYPKVDFTSTVCYAESRDGIHWEKPSLGIVEFNGSKDNNIILGPHDGGEGWDGFRPFIDTNPECKPEQRYKAVANIKDSLWLFTSPDGIHFEKEGQLDLKGQFDSVNTLFFNEEKGVYQCFFRHYHSSPLPEDKAWIRDIRLAESKDLIHWSRKDGDMLDYTPQCDWHMYINGISPYYRGKHVYVGFPSRYNERKGWSNSFEMLCGKDKRAQRFIDNPRTATAISDTLFMTSRDGVHWIRYGDAFMRPGPEYPENWVYGSVYHSNGMIETKSAHPGCENEISMYCAEKRWSGEPAQIWRYTIRLDGFVSQRGSWYTSKLVTKKFIFEGKDLFINFSTSAYGGIDLNLRCEDGTCLYSNEIFGDSCDRLIVFENGSAEKLAGKPVWLEMDLRDADVYSFRFE